MTVAARMAAAAEEAGAVTAPLIREAATSEAERGRGKADLSLVMNSVPCSPATSAHTNTRLERMQTKANLNPLRRAQGNRQVVLEQQDTAQTG